MLSSFEEKDPKTAAEIFSLILSKLRETNFASDYQDSYQAYNAALQLARKGVAPNNSAQSPNAQNKQPYITPQDTRELIEIIMKAAARNSSLRQAMSGQMQAMLPDVEKYAPSSAAALRRYVGNAQTNPNPNTAWNDFQKLLNDGNIDAALGVASNAQAGDARLNVSADRV